MTGVATSVGQAAASGQREAGDEAAAVVTFWPGLGLPGLVDVHTLARLDLGPAWLRAVCHDNAARLLGV